MIWPLVETLAIIEPHLPLHLISVEAFSRVKELAGRLPESMSSYYLECRLAAHTPQVDFLSCVTASDAGRESLLQGHGMKADLLEVFSGHPVWSRIRDFCSHWAVPSSSLYEQVPHLWLEFDLDAPLPLVPLPCLLFCLDPAYFKRRAPGQLGNCLSAQQYQQVMNTVLPILLERPVSSSTRKQLFACFDFLPAGGQLIHASVMLSRQPPTFKLNIAVPKNRLLDYLQQIGWTGSLSELDAILSTFCPSASSLKFQLTIGNVMAPKIDFEFHFDSASREDHRLQVLLDQAVINGLCTPEKREALLTWPGSFRKMFCHHSWPTRLYKWVDIKIVYHFGRSLEAKGYLGFMPGSSIF